MKSLLKLLSLLPLLLLVMCKKKDTLIPEGTLTAKDYVYNNAIKRFEPDETVSGSLSANFEMRTVYYYLQRQGKTDTLLQIDFLRNDASSNYEFALKSESWSGVNMNGSKGLKVLAVRDNNTSIEKIIAINYFDPAAPVVGEVPETITPNLTGVTAITGKITSPTGIAKVDIFDNANGDFELVGTVPGNNAKDLQLNYQYEYNDGAGQLKIEVTDIYGLKAEKVVQFVNIPFKPVITFASTTLKVALPDGTPEVKGTIKSFTALTTVNAYVVTAGGSTLHQVVTPELENSVPNEFNYSFTVTSFPFAENVTSCRLEVTDATGTSTANANVQILPYYYWKNLTMMAQGNATTTSSTCFFTGDLADPLIGPCDANANPELHTKIDFAIFTNSTPLLAFQNPSNISSGTLTTFKCNGTNWDPPLPNATTLMKTTFRVLTDAQDALLRPRLEAMSMDDLSDAFFTGVQAPTASAPNSGTFRENSLLYVKAVTQAGVTKNILIRVVNVNVVAVPNQATSTITFDILKQK
ncbi:hypothetical protein [Pseudobacter ginsenosidimutans]|uniref:Uncharacterized protein n=1 Tax=Pseudobacter ginsenosidimutans TaxID=661488 RepID=A0A4Q7N344_9BACT|nr:hypothetical protein [Pseudobacter ginsenosidimutans]QEC44084.1 hypothetical protein FSB84_21260 [Pseudobacter ginsenosidimutans]RZS75524.1 hypothetical protein EV199_1393 [Pseudobacter ginsenosidimutans]